MGSRIMLYTPFLLILVAFLSTTVVLSGCEQSYQRLPPAKELCLSVISYDLDYLLDENPIPHDEFSHKYDPYPKYPHSDYDTSYYRVFFTHHPIDILNTSLELAPGYSLENNVRVYRSVKKAEEGFTDLRPPRFGSGISGRSGIEQAILTVGDESKAWYYASEALDEDREIMRKQIEAEIYFRKGYVVSLIKVTTWGGPHSEESSLLKETASFLLNLVKVSEIKISESISLTK